MCLRSTLNLIALPLAFIFLFAGCRKKENAAARNGDEFLRLSNVGKAQLDRGEAQPAIAAFEKALALNPNHPDAKLNLANACLLAGDNVRAWVAAMSVLEQEHSSAPAFYVAG